MNSIHWICENVDLAKEVAKIRDINKKQISTLILLYKRISKRKKTIDEYLNKLNKIAKSLILSNSEKKIQAKKLKLVVSEMKKENSKEEVEFKSIMDNLPNLQLCDIHNDVLNKDYLLIKENIKGKMSKNSIPHWEIYTLLGLVNFEWGVKVGGSRLVVYVNKGAKLRRAIMNYQIDIANKNSYIEVYPPLIATNDSLYNSGHFPKFKNDVFRFIDQKHALVPTTETSICNFFANTILDSNLLPLKYFATSLNFRSEVGSASKDVRGCNRMKQFTKTELFVFCKQENSLKMFENMLNSAEEVLKILNLKYRIIRLSHKDISFAAQKTYDLEVWMPGEKTYKEVSSISLVGDFQARRSKIRHRKDISQKTQLCHTLNGTGVAVDRLMACIVETFYDPVIKNVRIPKPLIPYYGQSLLI